MNLFYDQSAKALKQTLAKASKSVPVHNVVVDYDGEVIVDPELHFAGVELKRFKYLTQISTSEKANERSINHLLNSLLSGYNSGEVHIQHNRSIRKAA